MTSLITPLTLLVFVSLIDKVQAIPKCIADERINAEFEALTGGFEIPRQDSCCMWDVCGLACPAEVEEPNSGFGVALTVSLILFVAVGMLTPYFTESTAENFFVAGRSLPLWIVSITLASQSLDSNALLGNVDLSYRYSFYDGVVVPVGLALSLLLNGIFMATHIHNENVLTLPDVFAKRYGPVVEVLVSLACIGSFLMLFAGNLVGFGRIAGYLWGINDTTAIWMGCGIAWMYTYAGGLVSVAYTDVLQGALGWTGCVIMAYWFITSEEDSAPPPSIGFPGYIYPDLLGEGGACDMYKGVSCINDPSLCCYNEALWCPRGAPDCDRFDRGAYPFGDTSVYSDQMTNAYSLDPFPNAIFFNWATIFILGFGNLAALDFQARCMAAKSARAARWGCYIGALVTVFVGVPFAYLGAITRVHYGPDSVHGEFEADSCALQLGLPTCALWLPDSYAFLKLLTHEAPAFLGAWCLVGIVAASMSTADGAILAMGTVFSHNIVRHVGMLIPGREINDDTLLHMARVATLPFALMSGIIAAFYKGPGGTGYLLIVAFDIVFATVVVPLFGAFYTKNPSPRAALASVVTGGLARIILEFAIPKDGSLLLPYDDLVFHDVGPAASSYLPAFIDAPAKDIWDPEMEPCNQIPFEDYTGVDSLAAALLSFVVFCTIHFVEQIHGRPLFSFWGGKGYTKGTTTKACPESAETTVQTS